MAIVRGKANIVFYRGDNPIHQYTLIDFNEETGVRTPVDLTDMVITGQIRSTAGASPKLMDLPIEIHQDPTTGIFSWQLTETESKNIAFTSGVYDMQIRVGTDPNIKTTQVITFLTGSVSVVEDVTREDLALAIQQDGRPTVSDAIRKAELAYAARR